MGFSISTIIANCCIIFEALLIIIPFQSSNNPLDFDMDDEDENGA